MDKFLLSSQPESKDVTGKPSRQQMQDALDKVGKEPGSHMATAEELSDLKEARGEADAKAPSTRKRGKRAPSPSKGVEGDAAESEGDMNLDVSDLSPCSSAVPKSASDSSSSSSSSNKKQGKKRKASGSKAKVKKAKVKAKDKTTKGKENPKEKAEKMSQLKSESKKSTLKCSLTNSGNGGLEGWMFVRALNLMFSKF